MTAASNSEARKRAAIASASVPRTWLAGIAASNPTAPEPAGTLEGAPGADSEALTALIGSLEDLIERLGDMDRARDTDPTGRAHWQGYDQAARECAVELTAIVTRFNDTASSWLADHDRQIAERVWDEGYWAGREDEVFDQRGLSTDSDAHEYPHDNPYSEEACRG